MVQNDTKPIPKMLQNVTSGTKKRRLKKSRKSIAKKNTKNDPETRSGL